MEKQIPYHRKIYKRKLFGIVSHNKVKLSKEEKDLLKDFEAGEFRSVSTPDRKKEITMAAEETFKKDKRINIRISVRDGRNQSSALA